MRRRIQRHAPSPLFKGIEDHLPETCVSGIQEAREADDSEIVIIIWHIYPFRINYMKSECRSRDDFLSLWS